MVYYSCHLGWIIYKDGELGEDVMHRIEVNLLKWRTTSRILCVSRIAMRLKRDNYITSNALWTRMLNN